MTGSVETFDAATLSHRTSHSLGPTDGSLTAALSSAAAAGPVDGVRDAS